MDQVDREALAAGPAQAAGERVLGLLATVPRIQDSPAVREKLARHVAAASIADDRAPDGDVTVAVEYSTLNYKDGLAITNKSPVVRSWPMVAGIDGSGSVLQSTSPQWKEGDAFVLNGWGVGETHKGCLAGKARLKGEWLVRRPAAFSARQAMAIGTAGYTAMLSCMALSKQGVTGGNVLVTGASGGVGSFAIGVSGSSDG